MRFITVFCSAILGMILTAIPAMGAMLDVSESSMGRARVSVIKDAGCNTNAPVCGSPVEGAKNVVIIGDSFSIDAYNAFATAYPDVNFILLPSNGCAPFDDGGNGKEKCPQENEARNAELAKLSGVSTVIVTLSIQPDDDFRRDKLPEYLADLAAQGKKVIMLGASLRFRRPQNEVYERLASEGNPFPEMSEFHELGGRDFDAALKSATEGAGGTFIDRWAFYCPAGDTCRDYSLDQSALLFLDGRHHTLATAKDLGQWIVANYPGLLD